MRSRVNNLLVASALAHVLAAFLAQAYNLVLRAGLPQKLAPQLVLGGKIYILAATVIGAVTGMFLLKMRGRWVVAFPLLRAGFSLVSWLAAVPILAVLAIRVNGHVDPIGFPHFVASIVIAALVATVYSSLFNIWVVLRISRPNASQAALLWRFANMLPVLAFAVPVASAATYLFVFHPSDLPPASAKALEYFLVGLILSGCYGAFFCRWALKKMRTELALDPVREQVFQAPRQQYLR